MSENYDNYNQANDRNTIQELTQNGDMNVDMGMPQNGAPQNGVPQNGVPQNGVPQGEKPRRRFREVIKDSLNQFIQIFREYPITIICIFLSALIGMFLVDSDFRDETMRNVGRIIVFLLIFAAGSLFVEESIRHDWKIFQKAKVKWILYGVLLAVFAGFAFFADYVLTSQSKYLFGIPQEDYVEIFSRFLIFYLTALILISVFLMYRRSRVSFQHYCISVFISTVQTTVVYGIFALGIALIIGIFDLLIIDTDDYELIARLELFLAGGIYSPAIIICFSNVRKEIGKFAKVVIQYAAMSIFAAAFFIIYLYIIKLLVNQGLPENELFAIVTWLFGLGLPIWTMAQYFDKPKFFAMLARILPYSFVPFIILQEICLMMRVREYGFTPSRYAGLYVILFEIIYAVLYFICKGKYVEYIVIVAIILTFTGLVIPKINCFAACTASQKARLEMLTEDGLDDLSSKEQEEVASVYDTLNDSCGVEGRNYIQEHFSRSERKQMDEFYYDRYGYYSLEKYLYSYDTMDYLDISAYRSITYVTLDMDGVAGNIDLKHLQFNAEENEEILELDLEDFVSDFLEQEQSDYDFLNTKNPVKVGNGVLFVTSMNARTDADGDVEDLEINGYLFY